MNRSAPTANTPLLKMRNIHVSYGSLKALNGVDFDLYRGEIHALMGEHRAGKSTLVKLLSGAEKRDRGEIFIKGKSCGHLSPESSMKHGIGIVYQNLMVIPDLNTIENIFSPNLKINRFGLLDQQSMLKTTASLLERLDCRFDCRIPLNRLTVGNQLMVEFARALRINPAILILDEISNKLTPQEMKSVYRIMFDLKHSGTSIIYISHDMDEIQRIADRVTILKNGYRRETEMVRNLSQLRLVQMTYSFSAKQERLDQHDESFAQVKKHFESVIQDFPAGILLIDRQKKVQLMNFEAVNIIGLPQKRFEDFPISDLSFLREPMLSQLIEAIDNQEQWSSGETETSDGKNLSLKTFPIRNDEQQFIGTTLLIQDESLTKCIDDYLIQTEKMASVAEVAVGVAHEINNPLCIIQNYIELIRGRNSDDDTLLKISKIENELERIVSIISSLLSFSRIQALPGNMIDVGSVLNEVLLLLGHSLNDKRVELEWKPPRTAYYVAGNENKLKQVFMNLIMNSLEAVLDSGRIEVRIKSSRSNEFVDIFIQDTGAGIPEEIAENIFNPFYTTKISRKNSGLGLSICRHIVEEHKGTIGFKSTPGESTVFTVRLPLARTS